ncbi:type VI secretion system lipoprotein TssJ [Burkholderia oklahomensis]|uniref:type VI secretion system lipoprotein TssJ n=1 Tax=Burkholderia oklahomensis TaxID=342113 RepID=UPI0026562914|nr:type VI secretion system lipoprotein TssJ [Burkholderia oklahomensis]MDN7672094.1 type VI secretion system lipoprotein TssJ [Burkholderia oklahomensis]
MRPPTPVTVVASALMLAACASGSPKPKEPIRLDLIVNAAPTVNPDDRNRAAPIVVSIYELKTDGAFNAADFFTLQDKEKTVLADDLVTRDRFLLRPGERRTIRRNADPATTALGIVAAYRDLPNSVWRAVYRLPPAPDAAWYRFSPPKLKLTIDLDTHAIQVTETGK